MRFYNDFPIPVDLTPTGIRNAITAARLRILQGDLGRFAFATRAFQATDLRTLPILHLLDHRIRGVHLREIADDSSGNRVDRVEAMLWRMLQCGDRADAREMVAEALRLQPTSDADALVQIAAHDPMLGRHLMRGRLGTAIRHINVRSPTERRATELALVSRLLLYFSCFSVQIVATRAWLIEHLPWRGEIQKGAYRLAGLASDLQEVADVIGQIAAYARGKRKRYPSRRLVERLKPLAARWRTVLRKTDAELRAELPPVYNSIIGTVRVTRKWAQHRLQQAVSKDITLHKAIFGVTAAEAVAFSATRLIQLRDAADALVEQARCGGQLTFPADRSSIPGRDDRDVATLIYVFRVMQLDDLSALLGGPARQKSQIVGDLRALRRRQEANGNIIGRDLIEKSRLLFFKGPLRRAPLAMSPSGRFATTMTTGQSLDVLPEFWLQRSLADGPKVTPEPPTPDELLARKRAGHEHEQQNRPPNVWRASGVDQPGRRGRRKR